ncbi:hypothetical protein WK62_05265 [Burkholderia ubonensis]|uniref:helix-turn-helix domain-containing protein n=1 Tax=Burkholderia ubonensis TaxID=101571 RepID=UPI000752C0E3|nr:helix-turn-helix domain-containing protein [Burkholderia ubonensis]KVU10674.1 hypothetical protein WK62_05265 [Burkholderia ubonensis]
MSPYLWLAPQKAAATRMYEAGAPLREIAAAVGRSEDAIRRAVGRWKLHRPEGHIGVETRKDLAWPRIQNALRGGRGMTMAQLREATGLSKQSIITAIRKYRDQIHIGSYERTARHPAAVWKLGRANSAEMPKGRRRTAQAVRANPFLVAAGLVAPPKTQRGRVFEQDMTVDTEELEAA